MRFQRLIAVLLLAIWGVATMHCALERLTGLEALSCGSAAAPAPHHESDCTTDACSVVESGSYRVEQEPAEAPVPPLTPGLWVLPDAVEHHDPVILAVLPERSSPAPDGGWHFFTRAALLPRAPSQIG